MKNTSAKFLEFQDQKLYFSLINGQWLIAIKPICIALGINYKRQHEEVKKDEYFSSVSTLEGIHDSSGRIQKMLCLPEFYIYGWLFGVKSTNQNLKKYKWECFKVLYNHFHGSITGRSELLKDLHSKYKQINQLTEVLEAANPEFKELMNIKKQIKLVKLKLNQNDQEILAGKQLELFLS